MGIKWLPDSTALIYLIPRVYKFISERVKDEFLKNIALLVPVCICHESPLFLHDLDEVDAQF